MPSLLISSLELRVSDLARSVDFYVGKLGFVAARPAGKSATTAALATSAGAAPLLFLTEDRHAPAAPRDAAGLFHAALLFPDRARLGRWLRCAADGKVRFEGFSDHGVSEAIYLADPDGNGLEFYVDRPSERWPRHGSELAMTTAPLDTDALLAAGEVLNDASEPLLQGAHWGHLHLRVTDLARSETFYRQRLGVEVTQASYPGARFLAADGYHHHLGLNTWGHPRQPQPAGALGLVRATFARAGEATPSEQRDPDGIALQMTPLNAPG